MAYRLRLATLFLCLYWSLVTCQRGIIFTMPEKLSEGEAAEFCVTDYSGSENGSPSWVTVIMSPKGYPQNRSVSVDGVYLPGQQACNNFTAPSAGSYSVSLARNESILMRSEKSVIVVRSRGSLSFIQTDKPIYKPGHNVKFRVLSIQRNRQPRMGTIAAVYIKDPNGFRVKQYLNIDSKGITSLNFQLNKEAKVGKWEILMYLDENDLRSHEDTKVTFEVKEYVLPRFEVTITPPRFFLNWEYDFQGEVCARFTYGKDVTGYLELKLCSGFPNDRQCEDSVIEITGCYNFSGNAKPRQIRQNFDPWYTDTREVVSIDAAVTEASTGTVVRATHTTPRLDVVGTAEMSLKFEDDTRGFFKSGLPFYGRVKVLRSDGEVAKGQRIRIASGNNRILTATYKTDDSGIARYTVCGHHFDLVSKGLDRDTNYFIIEASILGSNLKYTTTLNRWLSLTNSNIQIPRTETKWRCGQNLTLTIPFTRRAEIVTTMKYQVISHGRVLTEGTVQDIGDGWDITSGSDTNCLKPRGSADSYYNVPTPFANRVHSFLLDIPIVQEMVPSFNLLVYQVLPDGELVADSREFLAESCLNNNVTMTFNQAEALPGEKINIRLEAEPGSVCGLGVVDKSVNILGGKNQITMDTILEKLDALTLKSEVESPQCEFGSYFETEFANAELAFQTSGLLVLTDFKVADLLCTPMRLYYEDIGPVGMGRKRNWMGSREDGRKSAGSRVDGKKTKKPPTARTFFPETWLWDLHVIGENGTLDIPQAAPHTITSWVGNAVCLESEQGLGASSLQDLVTFQPFFLNLHLPYAAVRGETLPVLFTVYNYLDKCLRLQISLDMGKAFKVSNSAQNSEPFCVCDDSVTAEYDVTAVDIGSLPVMATARIIAGTCGNSTDVDLTYVGLSDTVKRHVLVKAEGITEEHTISHFMCAGENTTVTETVTIPSLTDAVEDSIRGDVKVTGDFMGPALTNLDSLVQIPSGCGEQNMVRFTPNIYVLKYLLAKGIRGQTIHHHAIRNMEIGYQGELNYRHKDGSYSAFGGDGRGSVWLTAFVVKSFAQANPFIFIDPMDIELSINFLKKSQLRSGCFKETGKVFNSYMMGGVGRGRPSTALTSYVLVGLLQAGVESNDTVIVDGINCLKRGLDGWHRTRNVYALALATYATSLYDRQGQACAGFMKLLESEAKKDGALTYWTEIDLGKPSPKANAPSATVETTAYALLAHLEYYGTKDLSSARDIGLWLSKQRNSHGGFSSTQDTVVGLNALTEFAIAVHTEPEGDVNVTVDGDGIHQIFNVPGDKNARLLVQTTAINVIPDSNLEITAEGKGCALVQVNVRFNRPHRATTLRQPSFILRATPRSYSSDRRRCDRRTLGIIVRKTRAAKRREEGMTLVQVKMVTSWTPIKDSMEEVTRTVSGVKRYEYDEIENVVTFYVDEISRGLTLSLDVEQDRDLAVSNPKAAQVSVVDYYDKDNVVTEAYTLRTTCTGEPEVPRAVLDLRRRARMAIATKRPTSPPPTTPQTTPQPSPPTTERACPICRNLNSLPSSFKDSICQSVAVYRAVAGRGGRFPLKIAQEFKPSRKIKINKFASFALPAGCGCDLLNPPTKRVFILSSSSLKDKALSLDDQSVIINSSWKIEKALMRHQNSCHRTSQRQRGGSRRQDRNKFLDSFNFEEI